ncbi:MAG: transcription antitermination protein NusB [Proteobacteria bacterium]|jgi:N utilization substance protein B|nr:transcription antitermination protein NusB [Pseudomonadota bacterium]
MQKKSPRHLARSLAIQGIYSYKINQCSIIEIEDYINENNRDVFKKANYELMHYLIEQTLHDFSGNVARYTPYLQRSIEEINLVEQIILAVAATELINNLNVPAFVVINEAVELAKLYGAEDSFKFINGLVDKLAGEVRKDEMQSDNSTYKK